MVTNLPIFETALYFSFWVSIVFYSIFKFTLYTRKYFSSYNDIYHDFTTGWNILHSKKDRADFEWETILYLWKSIFFWIILYLIVMETARYAKLEKKILQCLQITFSLLHIFSKFGSIPCFIVVCQPLFFRVFAKYNNKCAIWVASFISLGFITFYKQLSSETHLNYFGLNEYDKTIIVLIFCWMNLKSTCYYVEVLDKVDLRECFTYCFYFPTVFTGPFLPYKNFQNTYKFDTYLPLKTRFINLLINMFRFLAWMLFTDFSLHFVYVNATSFQPKFVESMDTWTICGYGYSMGQFFHLKYVVLYGLSTTIANFENMNFYSTPRCIGRIHLYSEMWRYFDVGLYAFLTKYIYLPVMKEMKGNKLLSSLLCFTFVYVWHGLETYVLIWSVLNYVGVSIEYVAKLLYAQYLLKNKFITGIGKQWTRRVQCLIAAPLLCMSTISNFYFFTNIEIGNIFALRILEGDFFNVLAVFLALYFCCQVSTELANVATFKSSIKIRELNK